MNSRMFIDAAYNSITRVAVTNENGSIEDFDQELKQKRSRRGNVYLATITRVEPSLQATFVDYGAERHGFLSFNEIHPDYFRIPIEDRKKLLAEMQENVPIKDIDDEDDEDYELGASNSSLLPSRHRYRIQEVIKSGQVVLVQVAKDEVGNKGAALTTYLSLAGRYCVLMPNNNRAGGVSRKISNISDRKRLRNVLEDLTLPSTMSLIIRTAGSRHSSTEIKRDYDFLVKAWNEIRDTTLASHSPSLIHGEGDLVIRALRDMYNRNVDEVIVDGEEAFKRAKNFMRRMIPSHVNRVKLHSNDRGPLFSIAGIEEEVAKLFSSKIELPSGGYLIIHQTEALVAIDVNSGRSTRERDIEKTALKTNLESADEVARQLRLRDLAGLIVIDFIDMQDSRNVRKVEKRMREVVKDDRARIQLQNMSQFGMMEMSRQRLRGNLQSSVTKVCSNCKGTGLQVDSNWTCLSLFRAIESIVKKDAVEQLKVVLSFDISQSLLNDHRSTLADIDKEFGKRVIIKPSYDLESGVFECYVSQDIGHAAEGSEKEEVIWHRIDSTDDIDDIFARGSRGRTSSRKPYKRENGRYKEGSSRGSSRNYGRRDSFRDDNRRDNFRDDSRRDSFRDDSRRGNFSRDDNYDDDVKDNWKDDDDYSSTSSKRPSAKRSYSKRTNTQRSIRIDSEDNFDNSFDTEDNFDSTKDIAAKSPKKPSKTRSKRIDSKKSEELEQSEKSDPTKEMYGLIDAYEDNRAASAFTDFMGETGNPVEDVNDEQDTGAAFALSDMDSKTFYDDLAKDQLESEQKATKKQASTAKKATKTVKATGVKKPAAKTAKVIKESKVTKETKPTSRKKATTVAAADKTTKSTASDKPKKETKEKKPASKGSGWWRKS